MLPDVDERHLTTVMQLLRDQVVAEWESDDLGVSSALATAAIVRATGTPGSVES